MVYKADDADEDLLRYIVRAFPRLSSLELHRYRKSEEEIVQYVRHHVAVASLADNCMQAHIAHILSGMKMLQHVYLNLDFHDSPKLYCIDTTRYNVDPGNEDARALELVQIFRCNPWF